MNLGRFLQGKVIPSFPGSLWKQQWYPNKRAANTILGPEKKERSSAPSLMRTPWNAEFSWPGHINLITIFPPTCLCDSGRLRPLKFHMLTCTMKGLTSRYWNLLQFSIRFGSSWLQEGRKEPGLKVQYLPKWPSAPPHIPCSKSKCSA